MQHPIFKGSAAGGNEMQDIQADTQEPEHDLPQHIVEVAVPCPLHQTFSYLSDTPLAPGFRVKVPFRAKWVLGVVTGPGVKNASIRYSKISQVVDNQPILSPTLLDLAHWLADYYLHPIGEVFKTMLPASQ